MRSEKKSRDGTGINYIISDGAPYIYARTQPSINQSINQSINVGVHGV